MKNLYSCFYKFLILSISFLISALFNNAIAGTILVADTMSSKITMLNDVSFKPIKEIRVGYMPHEVAVSPNGKIALVSNWGDLVNFIAGHSVSVVDVAKAKITETIELPKRSRPHGIYFLSDTDALVTAEGIQSLLYIKLDSVLDPSEKLIKKLKLPGRGAHMVVVDREQKYAYVSNTGSGSVTKIDLRAWSVVDQVKIGKQSEGITLTADENYVLTTDASDNYVAVVRTKDLALVKTIKTDLRPQRIVLANHGNNAVLTNTISGTLQILDLTSHAITQRFHSTNSHAILFAPANIAVRQDQLTAYVTNFLANNVSLVDLLHGKVLQTVRVAHQPNGIAISSVDVDADVAAGIDADVVVDDVVDE